MGTTAMRILFSLRVLQLDPVRCSHESRVLLRWPGRIRANLPCLFRPGMLSQTVGGGRVPSGDISPVGQSVPAVSTPSWQEWVGQSEANPFSQHPPPSLVSAVQNILVLDNLSYAKEHALSTDDSAESAPVLSSVPAAVTPAATLVWGIGPPRSWIDAPIVSRPTVGHSLLRRAAASIHAGSASTLNAPYDNNTWSSPFTIGYLHVGRF